MENQSCGNSKKIKDYGLYCNPDSESSCCKNFKDPKTAVCVSKNLCSDHDTETDLDTSEYVDAESSKWVIEGSNFKVFQDWRYNSNIATNKRLSISRTND